MLSGRSQWLIVVLLLLQYRSCRKKNVLFDVNTNKTGPRHHKFNDLTLFSALPHVAVASLMVRKEIGCVGVAVCGVSDENEVSAARDDGFSVADDVADVGDGGKAMGVLLVPQLSPTGAMYVGMKVQKFEDD